MCRRCGNPMCSVCMVGMFVDECKEEPKPVVVEVGQRWKCADEPIIQRVEAIFGGNSTAAVRFVGGIQTTSYDLLNNDSWTYRGAWTVRTKIPRHPPVQSMHAQQVRFSFDGLFDKDTDGHAIPKYKPGQPHHEKPQKVEVGQHWKDSGTATLFIVDRVDADRAWCRGHGVKLWSLLHYDSWQYCGQSTEVGTVGQDGWRLRYDHQKRENAKILVQLRILEDERTFLRRMMQNACDDQDPTMSNVELLQSLILDVNSEHERAELAEVKLKACKR